ncbi:hypothetical protein, partial [Streptococcus pneumoniae]|uniref:hypothetical protein n=1 Tax=Streptococcus pneumoniae TaxID=1313 RepID=UPI0018B0CDDB
AEQDDAEAPSALDVSTESQETNTSSESVNEPLAVAPPAAETAASTESVPGSETRFRITPEQAKDTNVKVELPGDDTFVS